MNKLRINSIVPMALIAVALAGCSVLPQTPAQSVYVLESGYVASLNVALQYKHLPPCPGPKLCSDPAVVRDLQEADNYAYTAITDAQQAVRHGLNRETVAKLSADAAAALAKFQAKTATLKVK